MSFMSNNNIFDPNDFKSLAKFFPICQADVKKWHRHHLKCLVKITTEEFAVLKEFFRYQIPLSRFHACSRNLCNNFICFSHINEIFKSDVAHALSDDEDLYQAFDELEIIDLKFKDAGKKLDPSEAYDKWLRSVK